MLLFLKVTFLANIYCCPKFLQYALIQLEDVGINLKAPNVLKVRFIHWGIYCYIKDLIVEVSYLHQSFFYQVDEGSKICSSPHLEKF